MCRYGVSCAVYRVMFGARIRCECPRWRMAVMRAWSHGGLALLCCDGAELESTGDDFEFVFAAVFEAEPG